MPKRTPAKVFSTFSLLSLIVLLLSPALIAELAPQEESTVELIPRVAAAKPGQIEIADGVEIARVVVKFRDDAQVRLSSGRMASLSSQPTSEVNAILQPYADKSLQRLIKSISASKLDRDREILQTKARRALADLNGYYQIGVTDRYEAANLINRLNALDIVEIAYFEPVPEVAGDISPTTPDYEASQDYLEPAPNGVDAFFAKTQPGGDGTGVKIIDIEYNWQTTHEDLDKAVGGVIGPYPGGGSSSDHGTAVIGEMIAGDNGYGVTGISPGADVGMVSVASMSFAEAMYTAVDDLEPGDLVLIELHSPGPRYDFQARPDQLGYIAMEYWQANFDAIQYAWAKGVVVVEAAGNGSEDFDDAIYESVFDTTYRNSHAIVVGAGYPPASGQDRVKQGFSNYGERVNVQGYGSGVYTTGYGGLFDGGGDINQYYTATFSGTSSASPIVTGAAACLQGYYKATYGAVLTSDIIRQALVQTGTAQSGDTSLHIGPRPNLAAAIPWVAPPPSLYTNPILVDTTVTDSSLYLTSIWMINRSSTDALDYSVAAFDTLEAKNPAVWVGASPASGTIPAADSVELTVTVDGSMLEDRFDRYKGLVEISWGHSGLATDSTTLVPVFVSFPCNDGTYSVATSDDVDGPVFNWISAKDLGTKISDGSWYNPGVSFPLDDGTAGPRNIGFQFPYYDTTFNRFYVAVNGGISFTDSIVNVNGYFSGISIPGAPFSTLIAPFWGDLIFDVDERPASGVYLYNTPGWDTLVIEWYRPGSFADQGDTTINFEIILSKYDGSITFQYNDVGVSGMEQTVEVGIGEIDCAGKNLVSEYPAGVDAGMAVRFSYADRVLAQAGNVNGEGEIDISDLVYLVTYMFGGGPDPIPYESGDVNCSGDQIDIADLVALVDYMFGGGPDPCFYWILL